jgi:carboxypeptidase Taq
MTWLAENVHSRGSLLSSRELLVAATGRPLDAGIFRTHLKRRYLA